MIQTKIQSENQQRTLTQKTKVAELWFLYSAFLYNVFYQCMKFQADTFYVLEVMA